jgi:hypothetical protein
MFETQKESSDFPADSELLICKQQTLQNDGAMVVHCKQYKKNHLNQRLKCT